MTRAERQVFLDDENFMKSLGKFKDREIAEKYNVKEAFVKALRRKLKIKKEKVWPEGIELYAGKTTDKAAAEILGCTNVVVFNYRLEHRIEPFGCHVATIQKTREIVKAYEEEKTLQKVADRYGVTRERVRQILVKAGYTKRFYGQK